MEHYYPLKRQPRRRPKPIAEVKFPLVPEYCGGSTVGGLGGLTGPPTGSHESVVLNAVDPSTGQAVGRLRAEVDKPKYSFRGRRYISMGVTMISELLKQEDVPPLIYRMALWMPSIANRKTNQVTLSLAAVRQMFPTVDKSSLSKALRRMVSMRLLRRESKIGISCFTINPHFAWAGSAKDHQEFVKEWDREETQQWRRERGLDVVIEFPEEMLA